MQLFISRKTKAYLVFFYMGILCACNSTTEGPAKVHYENGSAVAVDWPGGDPVSAPEVFRSGNLEQPVLGHWVKTNGGIRFRPIVPLTPGLDFVLRTVDGDNHAFSVPDTADRQHPEVLGVYPSGDSLPENLLKMYLRFSVPMQHIGNPIEHLRVRDESAGQEVPVFLKLERALWNEDQTRLTLWLDPGRIKTGLIPNETSGMPLQAGHRYTMVIDTGLRSSTGQNLKSVFVKKWFTKESDRIKPNPANWKIQTPPSGSLDPLVIDLGEPLDVVLSVESLQIHSLENGPLQGKWRIHKGEEQVSFEPATPWKKGGYNIYVNPVLEDLAGNTPLRLFDAPIPSVKSTAPDKPVHNPAFTIR